tara:strand:- start:905 stop:1243 length:339 start_codon:yes stop_codon:yes gene_type:complete
MAKIVKKPWGQEEHFTINKNSTIKILTVKPKQAISVQYHFKREEFWKILQGNCKIRKGNKTISGKPGDEFKFKRKEIHSIQALSKTVKFLEISTGKYDAKDIVRLEDKYGRT